MTSLWSHSWFLLFYDFMISVCFLVLKLPISNNQKLLCSYCLWKMPVVQCHCLIVSLWLQFWFHFVFLILKSHSKTINWIVVRSKWDPLSKLLCSISQWHPLRYDILAKFANCAFMLQELHSRNASRSWWKLFGCMWRHVCCRRQFQVAEVAGVSEANELPWTYHEHFNMFVRFHHWICKRTKPYSRLKTLHTETLWPTCHQCQATAPSITISKLHWHDMEVQLSCQPSLG